jgi:hypothetical protein
MPLGRYLMFTTSVLLALMFMTDRYLPKSPPEPMRAEADRSILRIHSAQKWPDAVVIDTSLPTITPPQPIAASIPVMTIPRDAFAQLPSTAPVMHNGSSTGQPRPVASRHRAKTARAAFRRMVSYQAIEFRSEARSIW